MTYEEQIERLTKISIRKPLLPETFIPWETETKTNESFLPEHLLSIFRLPEYPELTAEQRSSLTRHEVTQVMYSYAWSEALLCMFLSRYVTTLDITSLEYKFVLRLLIEEYRHQEMFSKGVCQLGCKPVPLSRFHRLLGTSSAKYMSVNNAFLSTLAVEMVADRYGDEIKHDTTIYPVVAKIAELHGIEEARHILFSKLFLEKRIMNAGFIRRTIFSYTMLLNIAYMRSMYVRKEVYDRVGIQNSRTLYRKAVKSYRQLFAEQCADDVIPFVRSFNGFNWMSSWAWRVFLKVKI